MANGLAVTEVKPPKTKARGSDGKTNRIDAELAALGVLCLPVNKLINPRAGSERKSLRILLATQLSMVTQQTAEKNALMALIRGCDLGIDARRKLTWEQYQKIAEWKARPGDDQEQAIARYEAKRLADSILKADLALAQNEAQLGALVNTLVPRLLDTRGLGPV